MLNIYEVYERFEKIGCYPFSTVDEHGSPVSRIAHFIAVDDEGLYFTTMNVKPFYRHLKANGTVSACGASGSGKVEMDEKNLPVFQPGFAIRVTGKVRELPNDVIVAKAADNHGLDVAVHDFEKYPATRAFVLYQGHGEVYDYDFELVKRDHKLERERFAFGGDSFVEPGLVIGESCIGCGTCLELCTFKAIEAGSPYRIRGNRCDECGTCYVNCPVQAISWREE
jgi:ferredoxin